MRQALTWKELWTVKNERVLHLKQNLQPASESPGLCSHLCKNTQGNDLGITGFRNHAGEFEALVAQTERICLQCRRHRFNPWVRKIPQRRSWQPTTVFLPGEFHGQRSLVGYSPWGRKKSDMIEQLTLWTKLLNCSVPLFLLQFKNK